MLEQIFWFVTQPGCFILFWDTPAHNTPANFAQPPKYTGIFYNTLSFSKTNVFKNKCHCAPQAPFFFSKNVIERRRPFFFLQKIPSKEGNRTVQRSSWSTEQAQISLQELKTASAHLVAGGDIRRILIRRIFSLKARNTPEYAGKSGVSLPENYTLSTIRTALIYQ